MEWGKIEKQEGYEVYKLPDNWLYNHYYEALNILFKLENALRVFVYVVLKDRQKRKWTQTNLKSDDNESVSISSIAKKRKSQIMNQSYLGYVIDNPLVYLTTGELLGIILSQANWSSFKKYFQGNKSMIEYKLSEVSLFRNTLAHFRPIKKDDIEYYKHIIKQLFIGVDRCIDDVLSCDIPVPENLNEEWYKNITNLSQTNFAIQLTKSKSDEWIRISLKWRIKTIEKVSSYSSVDTYKVIDINGANVSNYLPDLLDDAIYMNELVSYPKINKGTLMINKVLSFVLSRKNIENKYDTIIEELKRLELTIMKEEIMLKDNPNTLGEILEINKIRVNYKTEDKKQIDSCNCDILKSKVSNSKRSEFWGNYRIYTDGFIVNAHRYPWIDIDIATEPFPF